MIRDRLASLRHYAGYRGFFLALFGLYDLLVGVDVLITGRVSAVFFGGEFLLATTSLVTGLFLLTGVFIKRDRWHFSAAVAFKAFWAIEFFWLSLHYPILIVNGFLWVILAIIVFMVSSWPEPTTIVRHLADE